MPDLEARKNRYGGYLGGLLSGYELVLVTKLVLDTALVISASKCHSGRSAVNFFTLHLTYRLTILTTNQSLI